VVGAASLALAELGSIFTYDYTKDYPDNFDIPKKSGSCLMARGAMENDLEHFFIPKNFDIFLMARGDKVIDPPSLSLASWMRMMMLKKMMLSPDCLK
jgi:hypothetical protein